MSRAAHDHDRHDGPGGSPGGGGRVLWGRVIILGLALLLMFVLGRCTAGADAEDEQEVQRLESRVEELEEENRALEAELEAMGAGGTETEGDGDGEQEDGADDDGSDGGEGDDDDDGDGDDDDDGGDDDGEAEGASDTGGGDEGDDDGAARTHEVQPGESLYRLAERYYGDGDKFRVIANANGLRTNDALQPGQTLEIPPDPDA